MASRTTQSARNIVEDESATLSPNTPEGEQISSDGLNCVPIVAEELLEYPEGEQPTADGLGDFLKRVLGMGYASWTGHNDNPKDSFEDEQWEEPVILRFNGKEYKVFLIVNNDNPLTRKERPTTVDIGTDTEVEVALPLTAPYWGLAHSSLLDNLERYYKTFKLVKRNVDFSFTREVV